MAFQEFEQMMLLQQLEFVELEVVDNHPRRFYQAQNVFEAIPISGSNNENKYYNPNHEYNISWDYDQQNKPVMTLQNLYDFKMTSIWAFLIGMLTAFGFLFIFWIILKGCSNDTSEDKKLQPQNDKPATMCSCIGRYCCKKKIPIPITVPNKVCHAERHKYPLFSYKRSPKLRS